MRVVITGGTGFIGRHVVDACCDGGHEVIVGGRSASPPELDCRVTYQRWDPCNASTLLPPTLAGKPFMLVHLAWDTSRGADYLTQAEQVAALAGLLDYWYERGLCRVIVTGSAAEYGTRGGRLSENDSPDAPLSPYGWAKRSARSLLANWSVASGIAALWLRPFVVYGPGQRGNMAIPYAIRQAEAGEVAEFTDGRQQRDLVYVTDVANAILAAVDRPIDSFHTINVGTGRGVRMCDVLGRLGDLLGAGSLFHFGAIARRPGEPERQIATPDVARRLLDWEAQVDWQHGLERLAEAIRSTGRQPA